MATAVEAAEAGRLTPARALEILSLEGCQTPVLMPERQSSSTTTTAAAAASPADGAPHQRVGDKGGIEDRGEPPLKKARAGPAPPEPRSRPFTWSMSVSSLDGVTGFAEPGFEGPEAVSLAHHGAAGAKDDFTLLCAGWALADAVLGTASILRAEPNVKWIPPMDSDPAWGRAREGKRRKLPINVVVTASGDVDPQHAMLSDPALEVVLATSPRGATLLRSKYEALQLDLPEQVHIEEFSAQDSRGSLALPDVVQRLWTNYDVQHLDVSAGGTTVAAMISEGLVDEVRVTLAGQLIGPTTSGGTDRPRLFAPPPSNPVLVVHNNPHVHFKSVHCLGDQHIFIRGSLEHRK
jgi:riboflavin biosynthesis pyrimidine reductase